MIAHVSFSRIGATEQHQFVQHVYQKQVSPFSRPRTELFSWGMKQKGVNPSPFHIHIVIQSKSTLLAGCALVIKVSNYEAQMAN